MRKKELRCIHRHNIKTHPSCFASGKINYNDDVEFTKVTGKKWYEYPGYKIGYFDIESDGLTADWGTLLTWCIKTKGVDQIDYGIVTQKDLFSGKADRNLVESAVNKLKEFNIVITYYGTGFDIPFLRTKAMRYGIDFPSYGELYHFDMYYTVKSKLCLSRNSLDNACQYLGIEGKTQIDKEVWRAAKYGDPMALEEVLSHNKGDVEILEQLHDRIEFTRKWIKKSV
jgi:uncharacterized protein YprB with RNaseH-like and TPR domain